MGLDNLKKKHNSHSKFFIGKKQVLQPILSKMCLNIFIFFIGLTNSLSYNLCRLVYRSLNIF
jgi:hypothetical protein